MARVRGLLLLTGFFAARANAATLWVVFPEKSAPCQYGQVDTALRARLGDIDVRPGVHDVSSGDVQVIVQRSGDSWSLVVRAAGEQTLERTLPSPGTDCVALDETAALMVERYLDDIRWTGSPAVVARLPPPPPKPHWQMVLEVGGSGELGTLPQLGPGLVVDVGARHGGWQLDFSGAGGLPGQQAFTSVRNQPAALSMQTGSLQLSVGYGFGVGFGKIGVGVAPGVEILAVNATGETVFYPNRAGPALTPLPFLSVRLGYEMPLWKRLFLALRFEARGHLGEAEFQVTGTNADVFTRLFDGDGSLALGYLFF